MMAGSKTHLVQRKYQPYISHLVIKNNNPLHKVSVKRLFLFINQEKYVT